MRHLSKILFASAIFFIPGQLWSQEIEYAGSIFNAGPFRTVATQGNIAFCAGTRSLEILSVAVPDSPSLIGSLTFENSPYDIKVSGNYAFISAIYHYDNGDYDYDEGSILAVDVSDLTRPVLLSEYEGVRPRSTLFISGNYLYTADNWSGITILDISNPQSLQLVSYHRTLYPARRIFVRDNLAYIANDAGGLLILDINDPFNPFFVGSLTTHKQAKDVYVSGPYAYVAEGSRYSERGYFAIINIANPAEPRSLGEFDTLGVFLRVVVQDTVAFVAVTGDTASYLLAIDVRDPENPVCRGGHSARVDDISITGSSICCATPEPALKILDISDPFQPQLSGAYRRPDRVHSVAASNGYAYAACDSNGLWIADISPGSNLQTVASLELPGFAYDLSLSGSYCYVAAGGLQVVDITVPWHPVRVGESDTLYPNYIELAGNYVFMADGRRLLIFDVSDPTQPVYAGYYSTDRGIGDITFAGNYVYLGVYREDEENADLQILDISTPESPGYVGNLDTPGNSVRVCVRDNYMYVANFDVSDNYHFDALQIFDIIDPVNPMLIGGYGTMRDVVDVVVEGNLAFILWEICPPEGDCSGGMEILDITDKANPFELYEYRTTGDPGRIFIDGDRIYITDKYSVAILRAEGISAVDDNIPRPPAFFSLNYPNPFNAATVIRYDLPKRSNVTIDIYDILGRKITTVVSGLMDAGQYAVEWNGADAPSGLYFYRLTAGDYIDTRKMMLLK